MSFFKVLLKIWHLHNSTLQQEQVSYFCVIRSSQYIVVSIYKFEQWKCTKILVTSNKVCKWAGKTLWVNIFCCSVSQVLQFTTQVYKVVSKPELCIEMSRNHFCHNSSVWFDWQYMLCGQCIVLTTMKGLTPFLNSSI